MTWKPPRKVRDKFEKVVGGLDMERAEKEHGAKYVPIHDSRREAKQWQKNYTQITRNSRAFRENYDNIKWERENDTTKT